MTGACGDSNSEGRGVKTEVPLLKSGKTGVPLLSFLTRLQLQGSGTQIVQSMRPECFDKPLSNYSR